MIVQEHWKENDTIKELHNEVDFLSEYADMIEWRTL